MKYVDLSINILESTKLQSIFLLDLHEKPKFKKIIIFHSSTNIYLVIN